MKVTAIKTRPIILGDELFLVLNDYIITLRENSVIAITSKIVSICEGRVVKTGTKNKERLVQEQAEYYLSPNNRYNLTLTIKHNVLIPNAGIDESNGNGDYILWPKNPQKTANKIRKYLQERFKLSSIGVIIVDSKTTPLRWGVTGVAIVHSGFNALNDYIGKPDIFGRLFEMEKANVSDALAASAVVVMGEGNEKTPMAIIEELPFVRFQNRNPLKEEREKLAITIDEDLYTQLLKSVKWQKGITK